MGLSANQWLNMRHGGRTASQTTAGLAVILAPRKIGQTLADTPARRNSRTA
jgi:hypothetical protein